MMSYAQAIPFGLGSGLPIDFAAVTDVVQEEPTHFYVEAVKDAVVSNPQPVFRPASQAVMGIGIKSCAHFVYLVQDRLPHRWGELIKSLGESVRPDLKRPRHLSSRLACAILARGDLIVRPFKGRLNILVQFKLV